MQKAFKSYINQNILSILVQKSGFSFLAFNGKDIVKSGFVPVKSAPQDFVEAFQEQFRSHQISKFKADYVELSFLNTEFTFIPKEDFHPSTAENYYKACLQIDDLAALRFSYIPTKEAVVCFLYPEELEYFFEKNYDFVKVLHNASRSINKLPKEVTNTVNLIFSEDYVEIVGCSNSWNFYNCVLYSKPADIAYLLLHYLKNVNSNVRINCFGKVPSAAFLSEIQAECLLTINEIEGNTDYALISN